MTPLEFWAKKCQAREAPPRDLDILLLAAETRTLNKDHIHYGNRRYWHDDLAEIPVGAKVEVRAQPDYMQPDEIEVFYNGHHLCTAFAHDSAKGRAVTGTRVLAAQRRQRQRINATIRQKKNVLHSADRQIEAQGPLPTSKDPTAQDVLPSPQDSSQQVSEQGREPRSSPTTQATPPSLSISQDKKEVRLKRLGSSKSNASSWDVLLEAEERQQK
jgi:hypothetical protein